MIDDTNSNDDTNPNDDNAFVPPERVTGLLKWFDPGKGFGFIVSPAGGPDILLHANVLRNFGQNSVADHSEIEVLVQKTGRGAQAIEVLRITPPDPSATPLESGFAFEGPTLDPSTPLEPARVKWFDKAKGFGFANVFGSTEDVFIHVEILRRSGLADLQPGEAVGLRVQDGERGRMAAQVTPWDAAIRLRDTGDRDEYGDEDGDEYGDGGGEDGDKDDVKG